MRGNAEAHDLVAPGTLKVALSLLAEEPGVWTPIAGGTELMVAYAAGRLAARKLVSLWGLSELRFIAESPEEISIGAGSTFRDLLFNPLVASDFPLLATASSWIGSIANQNRATLGGNLVNGSPAADSSPVLLVYDAEIELISLRGTRRIPYAEFHTGYKRNVLSSDELLYAVHLKRRFRSHRQYVRKVGARRAMAIAKVALAGCALLDGGAVGEIRLAAASVAPFPKRLYRCEDVVCGRPLTPERIREVREAVVSEIAPIDDIRSSAEYRSVVLRNLLGELLRSLMNPDKAG